MTRRQFAAVFVLLVGALVFGQWPRVANALGVSLGTLQGGDALTECATTATLVQPGKSTMSAKAVTLYPGAETVYVGGPDVDTTNGVSVCASGCDEEKFSYDGRSFYCIASGSAADVKVIWAP